MSAISAAALKPAVVYPDDDGEPMSDNMLQYDWISILKWSAEAQFRDDPNVLVAGNHLIYPIEDDNVTRLAPDAYVAFGRPKNYRGSYRVWEEGNTFPQVVFEVWSPSNSAEAMEEKRRFYEQFGAEEYYYVYPEFPMHVEGWREVDGKLVRIPEMNGFTSPRLGWHFELQRGHLQIYGPNGRLLQKPDEVAAERDEAAAERDEAAAERDEVAAERDEAELRAERERRRAETLAAKLRELGLDPDNL